jgi:4-diphosphocytidyl-2-C-methyl-D-erythritol kinase
MIETADGLRDCLAPAKLNLFLHITGRRPDGYHALQTVFQLLDWGDRLDFTLRHDGRVTRAVEWPEVPPEQDLTVRAARLLQEHTGCRQGVEIRLEKCLPIGAGIGGGSSDAATTLLALNRLWGLALPRRTLQELGLKLGADVPFFIFGRNAFAEGVGETLTEVALPSRCFLVITAPVHVSTVDIFRDQELTRDSKPIKIMDFLDARNANSGWPDSFGKNDMQAVVVKKYAKIAQVVEWFSQWPVGLEPPSTARMTGSGASVFAAFTSRQSALAAQAALPEGWPSVVADSMSRHPLAGLA